MVWFTSKRRIIFHHHSVSPRYMFHVLKNSLAPSPLVQARHLDQLDPSTRDEWMKEWKSFRSTSQVKRSRLSPPPCPTMETPADIYSESVTSSDDMEDGFTLNVITESFHRPVHKWEIDFWQHEGRRWKVVNIPHNLIYTNMFSFLGKYSSWTCDKSSIGVMSKEKYVGPLLLTLLITSCRSEHISLLLSWWVFRAQW